MRLTGSHAVIALWQQRKGCFLPREVSVYFLNKVASELSLGDGKGSRDEVRGKEGKGGF